MARQRPQRQCLQETQTTAPDSETTRSSPVAPDQSTFSHSFFTQSELALALALVKSTPAGLATAEYLQQLQSHIKPSNGKVASPSRYIDTAEFWKDQYTRVHTEKSQLEDKFHVLEAKNQDTPTESETPNTFRTIGGTVGGQSEQDSSSLGLVPEDNAIMIINFVLRIGRQRAKLMKAFESTNGLTEITEISTHSINLLRLLTTALNDSLLPFQLLRINDANKLKLATFDRLMQQIHISLLACLQALDQICKTILGRSEKPRLVYQIVMFFRDALDLLHTVSEAQARDHLKGKSQQNTPAGTGMGEYAVSKYLSRTLAGALTTFEWKSNQTGHADILEGIICCVLEHTGRLLSEAVFAEHVAASRSLGNITELVDTPSQSRLGIFESRYIVQILHAVLGGPDRKGLVNQVLSAGQATVKSNVRGSDGRVVLKGGPVSDVRALIQSTLLKASLGGTESTMCMPPEPKDGFTGHDQNVFHDENSEPDWFIGAVWSLVGWDLVD